MKKLLILLLFTSISSFAFDIKPVDETKEGLIEAKINKIASDGKIIYNPIKIKIIQGNKPIVNNVKRRIIYPIGITPPKINNTVEEPGLQKKEDEIFLQENENKKSNDTKEIKINVDTQFEKKSKNNLNKPKEILPVNIE